MIQEKITIQRLSTSPEVEVGYSDDDIVIIDNVNSFSEISSASISMNVISFCIAGKAQALQNGKQILLERNHVLIQPPNSVMSDLMFSPDFEFKALFFTNRILQSFLHEKMSIWNEMLYVRRSHLFMVDERDLDTIAHFYDTLRLTIQRDYQNPYKSEIIQSLLRSAILSLIGNYRMSNPAGDWDYGKQAGSLFQRFLDLLHQTEIKRHPVEWYANELCVTPKHLTVVCKKNSGRTANDWITEHVLEEIRYYLKSTNLSIKEICDKMGFPNTSFFGKFVKTHFGMPPGKFRQ